MAEMVFQMALRQWVKRKGLTRREAAKRLGVSERMLYFYLQGKRPAPEMAFHISRVTGIPLKVILGGSHPSHSRIPIFVRY